MFQEAITQTTKASTYQFTLVLGGRYLFMASGTFSSAAVQVEDFAGNYLDVYGAYDVSAAEQNEKTATLVAAGAIVVDLPPGSYQFALAGNSSTAANVSIARCPLA